MKKANANMAQKILLITPPLTQLNTPYPATAYLTFYLKSQGFDVRQVDLGIELVLALLSRQGLQELFDLAQENLASLDSKIQTILLRRQEYERCIEPAIRFLQNQDPTLAHRICQRSFLPEGERFAVLEGMDEKLFGSMALQDKARFYATLFLEDVGDFIREAIDPGFGFSRYQEKISVAASSFDELDDALQEGGSVIDDVLLDLLQEHINDFEPDLACLSVPFPGNLYAALKCGHFLREACPDTAISMGGGYVNTELRQLSDTRVFDYVDFLTLDDGERPLGQLLKFLSGDAGTEDLCRTFALNEEGECEYFDGCTLGDVAHEDSACPDYEGLPLEDYLSIIEVANPMHRMWNDGRWNKLTLAHGCYWKRCTFCDVTLDYIERYEEAPAKVLVDRMERVIAQTGQTGFHFVDEAAPPAVLRDMCLEILKRGLTVSWWANVRFERAFSNDLCRLMANAGCIAVSGGLEVAAERILKKIKKGTNLTQVVQSTHAFSRSGILVHAYLMYGFPTQTEQETIDSLEVVRQLFEAGLVQSGFWHRFALTAHSPVGKDPEAFDIVHTGPEFGGFACNELSFEDPLGCDHGLFGEGLRKSLFNYMHGVGFDQPLDFWFATSVPDTSHADDVISTTRQRIEKDEKFLQKDRLLWVGSLPKILLDTAGDISQLVFMASGTTEEVPSALAEWLGHLLPQLTIDNEAITFSDVGAYYEQYLGGDFAEFLQSPFGIVLRDNGLLVLRNH